MDVELRREVFRCLAGFKGRSCERWEGPTFKPEMSLALQCGSGENKLYECEHPLYDYGMFHSHVRQPQK